MKNKYVSLYQKQFNFLNGINLDNEPKINTNNSSINFENRINNSICSNCNNNNLLEDFSTGTLLCIKCGQVSDQFLDYSPEWKQYEDGNDNARCGGAINPLLPSSSLGTSISGAFKNRMKTIHCWNSMIYKERSLNNEYKKIENICQKHNILKCIEIDAKYMYKKISECKHESGKNIGKSIITRGKHRMAISASCLYFACVKKGITYTPKELADFYNISYSEINKGIKNVKKLIGDDLFVKSNISTPSNFIKRYCNELHMLNSHSDEVVNIASNIEKLNIITEHNPYSLASACILLIVEKYKLKNINKKILADYFNISDVTINKTLKKIELYTDIIFDNNKTNEISKENNNIDEDIPEEIKELMKQYKIEI